MTLASLTKPWTPMSYGFLSDFVRFGYDGWTKFGTTGHPQGHCTLEGYMGLRPDDPDTNEYVRRMYEAYGEERAEEILGVNLHHVLIYPCNSVQPPLCWSYRRCLKSMSTSSAA